MDTGDTAPDFELPDQSGTPRRMSQLVQSGPVALFFFPAAMTSGCTKEACHFRDLSEEFAQAGGQPVGVSTDPVSRQQEFSQHNQFGFPLLSDADATVTEQFGVKRSWKAAPTKRQTFVISGDMRVVAVIRNELRMAVHADRALEAVRAHR